MNKKRGNRRASYSRKPNGRWQVRWRSPLTGKQRCHSCPDAESARRIRRDVEDALCRGDDWRAGPASDVDIPKLIANYIDDLERTRSSNTIRRLESFGDDLASFLEIREGRRATLPPELLNAELVSGYDRWLMDKGNAIRTRRAKVGFLLNAWGWGRGREAFDGRLGTVPTIEMPEPIDEQPVAPTWAQCDDAIRQMGLRATRHGEELVPSYREPFVCRVATACRLTGLRPLQAASLLKGRHIDAEARTLTITRDLPGTKTPQERRGRVVPIAPVARPIFLAWMAEGADDFLIPAPPSRALAKARARLAWSRTPAARNLWEGQPLKAFRKTFQTELVAAGADYLAVERLVGHSIPGAGSSYVASRAFWDRMVAAVELIPARDGLTGTVLTLPRAAGSALHP